MNISNFNEGFPVPYINREDVNLNQESNQISSFIKHERDRAERQQRKIREIWDECWALYRGKEDWSTKEEWQSKIAVPKGFNSVKKATNQVIRMLELSRKAWELEPVNPDDEVSAIHARRMERLLEFFLEEANFLEQFQIGLESGMITGQGVWKVWWSLEERDTLGLQVDPLTGQRSLEQTTVDEGRLKVKAIDPYNFFWLDGSTFNNWLGTIEETFVSKYQLYELAESLGLTDQQVEKLGTRRSEQTYQSTSDMLRFDIADTMSAAGNKGLDLVKITEYYGPLMDKNGKVILKNAHVILGNDTEVLKVQENPYWHKKPPYVAFSPLLLPFREEGMGIVEMTREIDRSFSRLANMSMDTLVFRLLPMFEAYPEAYEDETDLDTGIVPGKILKRNRASVGLPPATPIISEDISQGSVQLMAMFDRLHQEGALLSEIQQSLPRLKGEQTATEINTKASREDSFLSALAREIDNRALKPLLELSMDTAMQFMDTANDPRIASILGVGKEELQSWSIIDAFENIQGDYIIEVHGISEQINRIEALENLVQFMNIIGQNEAWMPYINQGELFKRILESFPNIRDVDRLVNDPATVEAQRLALQNSQLQPEIVRAIPGLLRSYSQLARDGVIDAAMPGLAAQTQQSLEAQAEAQAKQAQEQQELHDLSIAAQKAQLERVIRGEATLDGFSDNRPAQKSGE